MIVLYNIYFYSFFVFIVEEVFYDCVFGEIFLKLEEMQVVLGLVEIKCFEKGSLLL